MLDLLKLQEELVSVLVGLATEFPAIVRQHRIYPAVMGYERGNDVIVGDMDGDEASRLFGFDVALAKFRREAFEQLDLLVGKRDLPASLSLSSC